MPLEATLREKKCKVCGAEFKPKSAAQRYCSLECKMGTRICVNCRKQFIPSKNSDGKYCSHGCWKVHYRERKAHTCPWCGEKFSPPSPGSKYCSRPCANAANRKPRPEGCAQCGAAFKRSAPRTVKYCSHSCAAKSQYDRPQDSRKRPDGYRRKELDGYVQLKAEGRWHYEHRYVMAQAIGRTLRSDETIHHLNRDRSDNRLENLELRSGNHGPGQATEDLLNHIIQQPEIAVLDSVTRAQVEAAIRRVLCADLGRF